MSLRSYWLMFLLPVLLIVVGTLGYVLIEGWSFFDALYMTVITITTVGFLEVHDLSMGGRTFTMIMAVGGVVVFLYSATELLKVFFTGQLMEALGKQHMVRELAKLNQHLIVCGFGRMGRLVCEQFSAQGLPFVVIARDAKLLENFSLAHGIPINGDATSDEILKLAGIERARALITVVASDADNLYITMSGRLLNEKLFIVARAEDARSEPKLKRAGANRVVSPYLIGGQRVAQAVLKPAVVDFIELATKTEHLDLQLEESRILQGSSLISHSLQDSKIRQDLGVIVVAIKKPNGHMIFNPPPDTLLAAGDILIAMGDRQRLNSLEDLARGTPS